MSRAGRNVRLLARQRRIRALVLFGASMILVLFPFGLITLIHSLSPKQLGTVQLPDWSYGVCFLVAAWFLLQAFYFWRRSNYATQAAIAEEEVGELLQPLLSQGWWLEYGVRDRRVGDVDIFLLSPRGRAFTIDVKPHRGNVYSHNGELYRQSGKSTYPLAKEFLIQAKKQALVMQERKRLSFVTSMVVFSNADVQIRGNPIANVYVLGAEDLLLCLELLG